MAPSNKRYSAEEGISYLHRLVRHTTNRQFRQMVADGEAVHREYGRVFAPGNLARLGPEAFKGFLLYENNRHWWGIHRHQAKLIKDMHRLRSVLSDLLDETRSIVARIDLVEGARGSKPLPGLGKAVYTAILHVVHPSKCAVWNSISEGAMRRLGLWPSFSWGSSPGQRYQAVNGAIIGVARELYVDLWTLDSLWWLTEKEHEPTRHQFDGDGTSGSSGYQRSAKGRDHCTCSRCFQLKAGNLQDPSGDYCIDCA